MVQKLKSYFESPIVLKSFKNAFIGSAVMALWATGRVPWLVGIFGFFLFVWIYHSMLDRTSVRWSFWLLVFSFGIGVRVIGYSGTPFFAPEFFWISFFLSFLVAFFGVLGTGNFIFEDKSSAYSLVHTVALFLFIFFFGMLTYSSSLMWSAPFFIGVILLSREFFVFLKVPTKKEMKVTSIVLALLSLELLFLCRFLPLGFMNTAIFITLFLFILRTLIVFYYEKALTKRILLRELTTFFLFSLLIFAAVRWTI